MKYWIFDFKSTPDLPFGKLTSYANKDMERRFPGIGKGIGGYFNFQEKLYRIMGDYWSSWFPSGEEDVVDEDLFPVNTFFVLS